MVIGKKHRSPRLLADNWQLMTPAHKIFRASTLNDTDEGADESLHLN